MPIKKSLYPPTWPAISRRIRFERAGGRCERCGVQHGAVGARDANGQWREAAEIDALLPALLAELYPTLASRKLTKIVLTCSHFDRDPSNSSEFNIFALCQACHFSHDRADNIQRRKRNRVQKWIDAGQREFSFKEKK